MKRGILFVGLVMMMVVQAVYSAENGEERGQGSIRNNRYFMESVRLAGLAQEAYDSGDYDGSTEYSAQALQYARLSDEYVALQLKIKEANDAILTANARLKWAGSVNAASEFADEYGQAEEAYEEAIRRRDAEDWDGAITAALQAIDLLAFVEDPNALPSTYIVRPWAVSKDCLWNIASRPWAYGDSSKWRLLYDANKAKMPESDNPDLIHPGMELEIPAVKSEVRSGRWKEGKTYTPIR